MVKGTSMALLIIVMFLAACGQGTPVPTPTSEPPPSPTPPPEPTPTPLSGSDQRFLECWASLVAPLLTRVEDDHKGLIYAWDQNIEEVRLWLERLETDADEARETLERECPLPDNPHWREGRDLVIESMREFSTGASQLYYEFTLDTLLESDHKFEPGSPRYGEGIGSLNNALRLHNEAVDLLR